MNQRQWKKFAKQKITKISASALKGDVLLFEFDRDKININEVYNWYSIIRDKLRCDVICVPKNQLCLQEMTIDMLYELREKIDCAISRKIKIIEVEKK